jgi:hypothetical protein
LDVQSQVTGILDLPGPCRARRPSHLSGWKKGKIEMPYYRHWTNITNLGVGFSATCTGCDWKALDETRQALLVKCKQHQADSGDPVSPTAGEINLVKKALMVPDDAEAHAILDEVRRSLHEKAA